jgi:hypothetical protein
MKRLPWLILLAALNTLAATPPAEKLLPADTLAFVTMPDWTRAQQSFSNSSVGRLWGDPAMRAFKEKFVQNFTTNMVRPLEKELEIRFSDFTSLAQGQFTLAVTPNGWDGKSDRQPGLLWIVDVGDKSSQLKTNLAELRRKWTERGKKMRTDRLRDVEFTTVIVDREDLGRPLQKIVPGQKPAAPSDDAAKNTVEWLIGQSGSLLIVSDAAKDVEKVLALQSGSSVPVLADQAAFAANAIMLRDARLFVWINVNPIMATLARKPRPEQQDPENMMGPAPSFEKILNALGFAGVQTIAGNATESREGSLVNISITAPESARKGLLNILAVNPKDASPPPFVPADAVKFDRWRIDLQKAWATIENALVEISPSYAGFSKLILDTAGKDKDPNFDFRKQLLANLGDDIITYEKSPRTRTMADLQSPPTLTLLGAKNAEQLAASLQAVTSIFPPSMVKYNEREFLGRKVYSVTLPNAATKAGPLNYAASGGYVAFSSDVATLEEYLRSGEGNLRPLRDFPGLNDAVQHVGGTGNGYFSFKNQNETARAAFETAKKDSKAAEALFGGGPLTLLTGIAGDPGKGVSEWFDFSLLPPYDQVSKYFHFNVSAIEVAPQAINFKVFSPTPPQLRK